MDGNTFETNPRLAEAMRQEKVYEAAMASLERKRKLKESEGLTIMAMFDTFGEATRGKTFLARSVGFAKFALVVFAGVTVNYFFWAFVMNG